MNTENDRQIDELIGDVLEDDVPADVDRRLRAQLEGFRQYLGEWIHISETDHFGKTNEIWYSPAKDISARHDQDWIEYHDHRDRLYYAYDLQEKILYRVPEKTRRSMEHYASMIEALRVLMQSKLPVDDPMERLGFPSNEETRYEVVKQELENLIQDDREWLDYHLTARQHGSRLPGPIELQMKFRVDSETKLLQSFRCEFDRQGKHTVAEISVDYPAKGPADVFDLGVPKTAELVDRVPTTDLTRILETLRAGRQGMDDYRAIVIQRTEGSWRPSGFPEIIYRKGDKFRRDTAIWIDPSFILGDSKVKWPEGDKDVVGWWNECIKNRCFLLPQSIDHGVTEFTIEHRQVDDPDGSVHTEIIGVKKCEHNVRPDEMYPGLWSWSPEFSCRPPMGIPHETLDAVLEPNPQDGPPDTILLRVRNLARMPPPPSPDLPKLPPPPDAWHYWLDAARDYVVVRRDMIAGDGSAHSTIIDKMAKSPRAIWYSTRIRNKGAIGAPSTGETYDQIIDIYVDFKADLPDSLFEPPAPGRIH